MIRNMKVWICVACLASSLAVPIPQPYPLALDIIDLAAISRMSPQQLERLAEGIAAEEIMRTKRSSAQALSSVVSKASSGLQSKFSLLGQASAGAATLIASASSKSGHNDDTGYSYEPQGEKYDYWGLKKSIFYTLFQAVKAITGGVTILKGQLIKGGGALAATLGKVISVKGDAVSNLGKKIVSSAALSHKKPHSTPVYGPPPPPAHVEYAPPPSGYGAPTAPAHYSHTGPSAPTGFAGHKYPAHLDGFNVFQNVPIHFSNIGRGKLNGLHAGVLLLTPIGEQSPSETHETPTVGHTPLEPPPSIIHSVYSAIKGAFSPGTPDYAAEDLTASHQPPPPPQPVPPFKPMTWPALNSYGELATADAFPDYDPRHPNPTFNYAASKKSVVPTHAVHKGLTPEKIQKINRNLNKLAEYMNHNIQRSSEDLPTFTGLDKYTDMLKKGQVPLFPTPVVRDNEIGVLPAEFLPAEPPATTTTSTTTTTTTTTEKPVTTTEDSNRRKDVKYILRGNKIVQV